jgi:hypothetical protein
LCFLISSSSALFFSIILICVLLHRADCMGGVELFLLLVDIPSWLDQNGTIFYDGPRHDLPLLPWRISLFLELNYIVGKR